MHKIDERFYKKPEEFFDHHGSFALTYDDVSLATGYSEVLPRQTVVETRLSERLKVNIPIISSDMDTVTEAPMAIAMALNGGIGLIHYNMERKQQVKEVHKVKNHVHGLISEPITVSPSMQIGDILELVGRKHFTFRTFPVVDEEGVLLGLLPGRVVKERYRSRMVNEAMTPRKDVFTINQKEIDTDPVRAADAFFNKHMGIHKLLVVDDNDRLCGLFTLSDIERISEEERAEVRPARDDDFRLLCGVAISTPRKEDGSINYDLLSDHTDELIEAGVDALAISTAHGNTKGVGDVLSFLRKAHKDITLIAGNVTSADGVAFLAKNGADAIKVGQGPGSICTTRIVAGVGIPQFTALHVCSLAAKECNVRIIADGGITKSGDIVKALTSSDAVILGSLLAGCREAPGNIVEINGKFYKQYRGMGSLAAMKEGSASRYGHKDNGSKKEQMKVAAEGVEALKEVSGNVDRVVGELVGGLQSGLGYLGAANLEELRKNARLVRVSPAGQKESAPHDVVEVKTTKNN